ncbi:hypothetical protein ACAG25_07925 [Mycobacterium sp. pV006]|uniref:hypothetical protein n=1 Tax=Mycobacterium sp. pV006 TaxID=3238983 RepID=UPI00351B7A21
MQQPVQHRLHIVEAPDWKDAIITLLEPESPYQPWRYGFGEAHERDRVLLVLGTDPVSVVTRLADIGDDVRPHGAKFSMGWRGADVVDLATLAGLLDLGDDVFTDWRIDGEDAESIVLRLTDCRLPGEPFGRFGHSTMVAARNLLRFSGRCDGCDDLIDLRGSDARDNIFVHTVDPLPRPAPPSPVTTREAAVSRGWAAVRSTTGDWPAVVCRDCRDRIRLGEFASFMDFRFREHPVCPRCGSRRSHRIMYGMPNDPESIPPFVYAAGCCVREQQWHCGVCDHEWV